MPELDSILNEIDSILDSNEKIENLSDVKNEKEIDNLNDNKAPNPLYGKVGGAREGAGRPKGSVSKKTMDEKMAEDYIRKRVMRSLPKIMDSQMNLARGCQYLFKLKKVFDEKKGIWYVPKFSKAQIVKDKNEIADYISGEFEGREDCDYYFITSDKPDNKALDSLLDRTLGKATQNINAKVGLTISDLLKELE